MPKTTQMGKELIVKEGKCNNIQGKDERPHRPNSIIKSSETYLTLQRLSWVNFNKTALNKGLWELYDNIWLQ